jgi:hypothetical protein
MKDRTAMIITTIRRQNLIAPLACAVALPNAHAKGFFSRRTPAAHAGTTRCERRHLGCTRGRDFGMMRQGVPPRREGTLQRHRLVAKRGLAGKTSRSMSKRAFAGRDPLLDQGKKKCVINSVLLLHLMNCRQLIPWSWRSTMTIGKGAGANAASA